MDVVDVRIDVNDDVPLEQVEGFPQVFAFAPLLAVLGQVVGGQIDVGPEVSPCRSFCSTSQRRSQKLE